MQRGGGSKDTWVLRTVRSAWCRCCPLRTAIRLEPAGTDLPSRVAENLFWLGRYVERAEHTSGCCAASSRRLTDQDTTDDPRQVRRCCTCSSDCMCCPRALGGDVSLRKIEEDTIDAHRQASVRTRACGTR